VDNEIKVAEEQHREIERLAYWNSVLKAFAIVLSLIVIALISANGILLAEVTP
jgi:hypothetical protein